MSNAEIILLGASAASQPASVTFARGILRHLPNLLPQHRFVRDTSYSVVLDFPDFPEADAPDQSCTLCLSVESTPELLVDDYRCLSLTGTYDFGVPDHPWWRFWQRAPTGDATLAWVGYALEKMFVPHADLRDFLIDHGHPHPERIHVVGHGPVENDLRPVDSVARRITKEVYGKEASYFLAPTPANAAHLLAGYAHFRRRCPEPVRLLIAGADKALRRDVKKHPFAADITLLSELPAHEYAKVFASARALIDLSSGEIFPTVILDAWAVGVPVLSHSKGILLGGGAQVQRGEEGSIGQGLVELVTTPFLASGLVDNGTRRLAEFTWERTAARVAEHLRT